MRTGLLLLVPLYGLTACNEVETHSSDCKGPPAGWHGAGDAWPNLMPNVASLGASGSLVWNGKPVAREELRSLLAKVPSLNPVPPSVLSVDGSANCGDVELIRRDIDEALNCQATGLCGQASGDWLKRFPAIR